jgi:hypothetical protein
MSEAQCVDQNVVVPDDCQGEEKDVSDDGPGPLELHEGFVGGIVIEDGPERPRPRLSRGRITLLGLAMMLTYYMGVSESGTMCVQYAGANVDADSYCHSSHHCDS